MEAAEKYDNDLIAELKNSLKSNTLIVPKVLDIHPVDSLCNLQCAWCIGGMNSNNKTPNLMNPQSYIKLFNDIFERKPKQYWPVEIHICGSDSEPLINRDFIEYAIPYLFGKTRVKLITNGTMIDSFNIEKTFNLLDGISISLDVSNEVDFHHYKSRLYSFNKVIENIEAISQVRNKTNSKLAIYVSFVVTDKTFDITEIERLFLKLKNIGVNHIQIRNDYNNTDASFAAYIKNSIKRISEELNAEEINYKDNQCFDIKYNEYINRERHTFSKCIGVNIWPTINSFLDVYPCAHVVKFHKPIFNLNETNYYDYYLLNGYNPLNCSYVKCPSVMYYINYLNCHRPEPTSLDNQQSI